MSYLLSSLKAKPIRVIIVHGPPKTGKSRLAATESPEFPRIDNYAVYAKHTPPVTIKDQLWLALDIGGFDGLTEEGIEIENVLDYRGAIDAIGLVKANIEILKEASSIVKQKPHIRTLVMDTLSVYDDYLVEYWGRMTPKTKDRYTGEEKRDNRAMFGYVKEHHRKNAIAVSSLGLQRAIYLCHTRLKGEGDKGGSRTEADQALKREATDTPYTGNLQPGITGGGAECYKADGTFCLAMKTTREPGKDPRKVNFEVLAWAEGEWEAWTRIKSLDPIMKPDLLQIIRRAENG